MKQLLIFILFVFVACQFSKSDNHKNKSVSQAKEKNCIQNFDDFFRTFSKDSTFQKRHVKYPIKILLYEWDESLPTVHVLNNSTEFHFIDFASNTFAMENDLDKFKGEKIRTKDGMAYKRIGYDNGIMITYDFKLLDGCWYLIRITDEST